MLAGLSVLCFRQCPWYLEYVMMYARYKFCRCAEWAAEAGLLFPLREWSIHGSELLLTPGTLLMNASVIPVA